MTSRQYELLGIQRTSYTKLTPLDIDRAFRRASLKYHPDHGGTESQFQSLLDAKNAVLAAEATPRVNLFAFGGSASKFRF